VTRPTLAIVGNPEETHVGAHFLHAAQSLGLSAVLIDARQAYAGPAWRRHLDWRVRGRRPSRLRKFGSDLLATLRQAPPQCLLTTGIAPVDRETLDGVRALGVTPINFLTDDPWNPAHRAPWFFEALAGYEQVFSPREANLADLRGLLSAQAVSYLPFGYAPEVHFPQLPVSDPDRARFDADILFAGGGDDERRPMLAAFVRAGFRVALYGSYWDRHPDTRRAARGHLDASGLRQATAGAAICLCLVRRANRDGHAMRSYEVPAMQGCVLAEDTADHRRLFGKDGTAAGYFNDVDEAIAKARRLLADANERRRLAAAAHHVVTSGDHRYSNRLQALLTRTLHVAA
jgi:spore maturation protein CgeB